MPELDDIFTRGGENMLRGFGARRPKVDIKVDATEQSAEVPVE